MMASGEKAIGLFGGTFDPVHNGHLAVAQSYLNSGFIDELWVVLTPDPPHKAGRELSRYELRKEMLEQAFAGMSRVTITDVETRLPRPSYTIQTVRYLAERYGDYSFYLCIGEDSLVDFERWYKWEEILEHCDLLVARRPNTEINPVNSKISRHAHFIEHSPVEVSSSELREKISRNEEVSNQIPDAVRKTIHKHRLYQNY